MPGKDFPPPPKPYSLKQIVRRILDEPDYAKFIHDKACKARAGDAAAAAVVAAHFEPLTSELNALNIPAADQAAVAKCTDTRTHLIAFAGMA